jgi:predicted alpha/beta hydrolase family esterase
MLRESYYADTAYPKCKENWNEDNDPYVKYEVEKDFANKIATEQILIPNAGHINSESGYDTFEDIVSYL